MEKISITRVCDFPDCHEYQAIQIEYLVAVTGKGKRTASIEVDLCKSHLDEVQAPFQRLKRNIGVRKVRSSKKEE